MLRRLPNQPSAHPHIPYNPLKPIQCPRIPRPLNPPPNPPPQELHHTLQHKRNRLRGGRSFEEVAAADGDAWPSSACGEVVTCGEEFGVGVFGFWGRLLGLPCVFDAGPEAWILPSRSDAADVEYGFPAPV